MRSIFKVFYCDISQISFEEYNIFRKMSSRECRNAAEHFHFYEDAVRCIMAEVLLKYELYECNLYPETFEWKYSEYGKPYIESFNNFFFNISHSGKWVVVAISDKEVGIDVEKVSGFDKEFYHTCCSKKERMYLMKLPHDRDKAFIELWTLKESYLKYEGTGLMTDISSFTVDKNKNCIEFDDNSKVHISFWTYVNTLDKKSRKIMLLFLVPHPPFAVVSNNQ